MHGRSNRLFSVPEPVATLRRRHSTASRDFSANAVQSQRRQNLTTCMGFGRYSAEAGRQLQISLLWLASGDAGWTRHVLSARLPSWASDTGWTRRALSARLPSWASLVIGLPYFSRRAFRRDALHGSNLLRGDRSWEFHATSRLTCWWRAQSPRQRAQRVELFAVLV